MDVRCPRCHVEYEFDDDKVTGAGVAVQCTGCGHVFRVASKTPHPPTTTAGVEREEWMVRQSDGRTIRFKELTTLQKWIVEQKVARTDEISRTGRTWRPLGDIAELSSFFQVVDAARAAQSMAAQGIVSAPVMPPPNAVLPVVDPAQHTLQLAAELPMPAPTPRTPIDASAPHTPAIQTASTETFFADDAGLDALDDDDPVKALRSRGRARNAALLTLVVVLAAVGSLAVLRPDLVDRARALVSSTRADDEALEARVTRALIDDKEGELEAVDKVLETALLRAPRASLHALRARTLVARARNASLVRFSARDEQARATLDRTADQLVEAAGSHALSALADPSAERAARLAHADVQGARGALLEMESDLDLVVKGDASPETMREVAVVRALGGVRRALQGTPPLPLDEKRALLAQVVKAQSLSPDDTRLAFAAAVVDVASLDRRAPTFDAERAARIADVERGLVKSPYHLGFRALREHLDALASAPTSSTTTTTDGGPAAAAGEKPTTEKAAADDEARADKGEQKGEERGESKGEPKGETESFDSLLAKAERLRRGDRAKKALALYQRAAALRPSDPRPHIGIGWANLDADKLGAAVTAFKKALAVDDGAAEAHLGLGEVYRAREEKPAAIAAFKTYLRLAPNGDEAGVAKRAIEQLERAP